MPVWLVSGIDPESRGGAADVATTEGVKKRPFEAALENFDIAANELELDVNMRGTIKCPERVLEVNLPVRMDDGSIRWFTGYLVLGNLPAAEKPGLVVAPLACGYAPRPSHRAAAGLRRVAADETGV